MTRNEEMKAVLESTTFKLSGGLRGLFVLFVAIGLVGFIVGASGSHPPLAWQALLTNTVYFGGIAFGGLMFSVIWHITDANWGRPYKRFSEALGAFAPIAGLLYLVLFFGAHHFFQWMDHDKVIHSKAAWLNFPFFVERNVILYVVVLILAFIYVKNSLRPDIGLAKKLNNFSNGFADKFVSGYGDQDAEQKACKKKNDRIAVLLAMGWGLLSSLIAFDWIMSIDQEWFSTMFGVQYLAASLITGMACLNLISGVAWKKLGLDGYINTSRHHDTGKFIFAFCLLFTYMVFSQVLVIWYGNIPEETPYLLLRMHSHEWGWLFWVLAVMIFLVPFFGLMPRTVCNLPWASRIFAIDVLVAIWLEKYFLIAPSIQENMADAAGVGAHLAGFQYNIFDFSITLGVLGAFLLSVFWFLSKVPAVPISDPRFYKEGHH